jgi:tetratricopeptide (TPR) repeat protein
MAPEFKTPPSLADLTLRFVNRPVDAGALEAEAAALGEVEPHEVSVGFRADPRLAWNEGLAAFGLRDGLKSVSVPSEWAAVVVRHEAVAAQPFALAGYPQRVRDLTTLVQAKDLAKLNVPGEARAASPALRSWAAKQAANGTPAAALLAAATLRAAHDHEQAQAALDALRDKAPAELKDAFANEEAALLWESGDVAGAAKVWERLPENPAVLFNRGLAALFLGQSLKARDFFKKAVAELPETSGWHHLGGLYLTLAEMRG